MKIVVFGKKNPNTVLLENNGTETWYYMSDKVKSYMEKMPKGTEVEIQSHQDDKGKLITFVQTIGATRPTTAVSTDATPQKTSYAKPPDERDSIESQAIGHMVSRTIVGLAGTVDINNVLGIIDTLYEKYASKIAEHKLDLRKNRPM